MPTEAEVQVQVIAALRAEGCYVVRVSRATVAGTPDLLVCYEGRFLTFEVKGPRGRLRPDQRVQHMLVERAGGTAYVCTSAAQAVEQLYSER